MRFGGIRVLRFMRARKLFVGTIYGLGIMRNLFIHVFIWRDANNMILMYFVNNKTAKIYEARFIASDGQRI